MLYACVSKRPHAGDDGDGYVDAVGHIVCPCTSVQIWPAYRQETAAGEDTRKTHPVEERQEGDICGYQTVDFSVVK